MGITYRAANSSGNSDLVSYFSDITQYVRQYTEVDQSDAIYYFYTDPDRLTTSVIWEENSSHVHIGRSIIDDLHNYAFETDGTLSGDIDGLLIGRYMEDRLLSDDFSVEGLFGEDDDLTGNISSNVLDGFAGNDKLDGSYGDDYLFGGAGNDNVIGGYGHDTLDGGADFDTLDGGDGDDAIYGEDGLDVLTGGRGFDLLDGGAGDEGISGGDDNDTIRGGDGDDRIDGGRGADLIDGGEGFDQVIYLGNLTGVTLTVGRGRAKGGDAEGDRLVSVEGVLGSQFADRITGSVADDSLVGFDGNDRLTGGGGDDVLIGSAGADRLDGGAGRDTANYDVANVAGIVVDLATGTASGGHARGDTLVSIEDVIGSDFADRISGSAAANQLRGGTGADTLAGAEGADLLLGGVGDDLLTGGAGRDVFQFGRASAIDTINDWQDGIDRIAFVGGDVDEFSDLTITATRGKVTIASASGTIQVSGGRLTQFTAADFDFETQTAPSIMARDHHLMGFSAVGRFADAQFALVHID